jgi:hypothetical protein
LPRDFSQPFAGTIDLEQLWKYRFPNNSLVLDIRVEAKVNSNPVSNFWELRMISASSACYIRSLNLKPWSDPNMKFNRPCVVQYRKCADNCIQETGPSLSMRSVVLLQYFSQCSVIFWFKQSILYGLCCIIVRGPHQAHALYWCSVRVFSFCHDLTQPCDSIHRKPSGIMVLTLVYYSTQINSIIKLSACNSTCTSSGKRDGLFFTFAHKGALLPRCQLQSNNVEQTMCFQPRCFPNEVCATSVSGQIF